jgi:hypothetical protein
LLKDLRSRLSREGDGWKVDPENYTLEQVTARVDEFFAQKAKEADLKSFLMLRICGYSSGNALPEVWQVMFGDGGERIEPSCIQSVDQFGVWWNGEVEALNRLILGIGEVPQKALDSLGMTEDQMRAARELIIPHTFETLILNAAPVQDAIDLSKYLVDVTKGFIRFSITKRKTVGGPVEVAAITKHEGFKWVQRKHFYPRELNR